MGWVCADWRHRMTKPNRFRYFKTSPEIIRLAVILHVRFPLTLRNVEDLSHERGIEISHEMVRFWWNRFDPLFAAEIHSLQIFAPVHASVHNLSNMEHALYS